MPNIIPDFKKYLQYLPLENQIREIDSMLPDFYKSNWKGENVNKKLKSNKWIKSIKKESNFKPQKYLHSHLY